MCRHPQCVRWGVSALQPQATGNALGCHRAVSGSGGQLWQPPGGASQVGVTVSVCRRQSVPWCEKRGPCECTVLTPVTPRTPLGATYLTAGDVPRRFPQELRAHWCRWRAAGRANTKRMCVLDGVVPTTTAERYAVLLRPRTHSTSPHSKAVFREVATQKHKMSQRAAGCAAAGVSPRTAYLCCSFPLPPLRSRAARRLRAPLPTHLPGGTDLAACHAACTWGQAWAPQAPCKRLALSAGAYKLARRLLALSSVPILRGDPSAAAAPLHTSPPAPGLGHPSQLALTRMRACA